MGEIIDLGKAKKKIIQSSREEPIMIKAVTFLRMYGFLFIDTDIIQSAIYQGGRTMEDLVSFYLNWTLEKKFKDVDYVIRGASTKEVVEKFIGIHLFEYDGLGPLRWAIEKINQGRFDNFQQAWRKINQNDGLDERLSFIKDSQGKYFLFDPFEKVYRKGYFKINRCWSQRDGEEYFLINNREENFFILNQGQNPFEVLKGFENNFS